VRTVNVRFVVVRGSIMNDGLPVELDDDERIVSVNHEGGRAWVYIVREEMSES
jgi:hypothetical protein